MAQEDIKPYEEQAEYISRMCAALADIAPLLRENRELSDYLNVKWYLVGENWESEFQKTAGKKLAELDKYMNCAHIKTKEEWEGNDSHKDYYKEKCINCGKTIKEWTI